MLTILGKGEKPDKYSELAAPIGYDISIFNKKPTWPIAYTEADSFQVT